MSRNLVRWAGAAVAAQLALAPACAQTAPADAPDSLGLRTGDAALPAPAEPDAPPALEGGPSPDDVPAAKPQRRPGANLPPLTPYPRAERLGLKGGPDPGDPAAIPAPTVAAVPAAPRRTIKREDKPFDPVGLFVGNLRLTPYVEQDVGYASNPFGASTGVRGSAFSQSEVGVGLQSNWSRNELTGSAKLGYIDYFQTPAASAPYGSGLVDYRYDVSRDLTFNTEGRFNIASETYSQLGFAGSAAQSVTQVSTYGATLGGENKFGDLAIELHGTVDRLQYQGGDLATDNYTDYGTQLRTSYHLSEAVQPFAEVDGDVREYDNLIDASGYDRASDGVSGKAGLKLGFSELLSAEASAGYGVRAYRDARLPDVGAPLIDAAVTWTVTPLTTVAFRAATSLQDAVLPGASADINRTYTINLDHALTERIKLGVSGGFATDTYVGLGRTDRTYTMGATGEYHLSRDLVLKATLTRLQLASSLPGGSYVADTALLGVRWQR